MFKKRRINHIHGAVNIYEKSDGTVVYENIKLKTDTISEEEMEKRERVLKKLNEVALREKYPLIPEKRVKEETKRNYNREVVVDKPIEDSDWIRQELMKMDLERKLEGTFDTYQERNRIILKKKSQEEAER